MISISGIIEYHFRGGSLGSFDFCVSEQLLVNSTLSPMEMFLEIVRRYVPSLVEMRQISWSSRTMLVLEVGLTEHFYVEDQTQIEDHHFYRHVRSQNFWRSCSPHPPLNILSIFNLTNPNPVINYNMYKKTEVPTTYCFECGREESIEEIYTKKNDPNYALCASCFKLAERAGRAKL